MAGSVNKRVRGKKTTYRATIDLGKDADGNRHQLRREFDLKRDAVAQLSQWEQEKREGRLVQDSKMTLGDVLQYWIKTYVRTSVKPKTAEEYERQVRLHIMPVLGNVRVSELTSAYLQKYYADLLGKGVGERTINLVHLKVKQALQQAVDLGAIAQNVATRAKPPKYTPPEMDTWTTDEARQFLRVADPECSYGPIFRLALLAGLRRGELLGLRWRDVDWERGSLRVRQSMIMMDKGAQKSTTKSKHGLREVPVDGDILKLLDQHHTAQLERRRVLGGEWEDNDLVFPNGFGRPILGSNLHRLYNRLVEKAGVRRIRVHDQRHTFASWALEEGADLKAVSIQLGHGDIAITGNIYQHLTSRMRRDVSDKVSQKLGPRQEDE